MDNRKKQLKAEYKMAKKPAGIFAVRNTENGKVLLGSSLNLNGSLNRHRFLLTIGTHLNPELQKEWNRYGASKFTFEILDSFLPKDDPAFDTSGELAVLEGLWLEKLQPFGERGYNQSSSIREA